MLVDRLIDTKIYRYEHIYDKNITKSQWGRNQETVGKSQCIIDIDRLVKGGLTNTAAIGIVANLQAESNLDPSIKQYGGGPGRGLAQWEKGGRFDTDRIKLVKFAEDRGTSWTDLNTQIDFILKEMRVHPEYKKVKAMLNNAKNVDDATMIFLRKYEKAGTPHTDKRLAYAKDLAANQG